MTPEPVVESPVVESTVRTTDSNIIYVSNKRPVMNYVLACVTQFNKNNTEVKILARGKAIVRAIDTAEVARRKFLTDVTVASIEIGTAHYPNKDEQGKEDGTTTALSTIEIILRKKGN